MRSSRASWAMRESVGPSRGSAALGRSGSEPIQAKFSGRPTRRAPMPAACRTSRVAASRLWAFSAVDTICAAAIRCMGAL